MLGQIGARICTYPRPSVSEASEYPLSSGHLFAEEVPKLARMNHGKFVSQHRYIDYGTDHQNRFKFAEAAHVRQSIVMLKTTNESPSKDHGRLDPCAPWF